MLEVVKSHHEVLLHWAKCRGKLQTAPRLITLDHHTDTSAPFRKHIDLKQNTADFISLQKKHLEKINFKSLKTVSEAILKLSNDEHIVTAIKTDILSSALVLAKNAENTSYQVYQEHKIICRELESQDLALESQTLNQALLGFEKVLSEAGEGGVFDKPYILDIDLDYFNTFKSIKPKDSTVFKRIVKGATLVTIATEPDYVQSCALDSGLTSDFLLEELLSQFF